MSFLHLVKKKNFDIYISKLLFSFGGAGGNRTRVQDKPINNVYSLDDI